MGFENMQSAQAEGHGQHLQKPSTYISSFAKRHGTSTGYTNAPVYPSEVQAPTQHAIATVTGAVTFAALSNIDLPGNLEPIGAKLQGELPPVAFTTTITDAVEMTLQMLNLHKNKQIDLSEIKQSRRSYSSMKELIPGS